MFFIVVCAAEWTKKMTRKLWISHVFVLIRAANPKMVLVEQAHAGYVPNGLLVGS
jgi:hypothetical protein